MPPVSPARRLRRLLPLLLALALAGAGLVALGCGSSSGGSDNADPAKVAPKSTLVYFSGYVRPQGAQKDAVDAIAKKVLGVNEAGKRIQALIDQSIKKSGSKASYKDDIAPWLGRRAAVAVTSFGTGSSNTQAAVIFASKDNGKAKDAVNAAADDNKPKLAKQKYQGVEYRTDGKAAAGVVGDYVVIGTETGFKATVDASKGESLTDNQQYSDAAKGSDQDLGFGFIDTKSIISALGAQGSIPGGAGSLLGAAQQPITMTLNAKPNQVKLEATSAASGKAQTATPSQVLPTLPGDSWLAFGLPGIGKAIRNTLNQLGGGVGAGIVQTAEQQLKARTGLDLVRDILPTFGDLAVFVRGSGLLTVGGGVVIKPESPAAAARVLAKLPALILRSGAKNGVKVSTGSIAGAKGLRVTAPKLPGSIDAVLKGDRLVIAYTDAATREALAPSQRLGDSPEFQQATASLAGAVPALYVAFAPIASIASASSPASAAQIKQYLGALTTLAAGSQVEGGKQIGRFVVNLK